MNVSQRKSKLNALDVFNKTDEDVRVRTNSGGLITVLCCLIAWFMILKEWQQLFEIQTVPQLVVDRDRIMKLDLNLDITFPSISCDLLTMDIMDDSGDLQLDILDSGFTKTRIVYDNDGHVVELDQDKQIFKPSDKNQVNGNKNDENGNNDNGCGSCYGALDQSHNDEKPDNEKICCRTCDDVHEAYIKANWAFFDGKDIEQCEREGYVKWINDHLNEGCRVQGTAKLNRIQGNIHFAPGKSFQNYNGKGNPHGHDLSLYNKNSQLNFNHIINHLSFGKEVKSNGHNEMVIKPLDGHQILPEGMDTHFHVFSYFAKIVPTRYEYLFPDTNGNKIVETAQFSATYHDRPMRGGRDSDHPTTIHMRGGTPGVFINFEMSPIKVINHEEYASSWSSFFLNCIITIGAILAVGTMSDKVIYKAQKTILSKKNK